jgi:alpha-1,3-rhamnosyl/mannosyltransferase
MDLAVPVMSDTQRPKRVCVDLTLCEFFDRHGGIARYGVHLLRELCRLPEIDRDRVEFVAMPESHRPPIPAEEVSAWLEAPPPEVSLRRHRIRRPLRVPRILRRSGIDLLHAIDPNLLPISLPVPVIATCHDLIPVVLKPERQSERGHRAVKRREMRRFHSVDHLIADSENTRQDLIRELGVDHERISVVHLGVQADRFARLDRTDHTGARRALPERYFVSVGSDYHRKNQVRLAEAWASVADEIEEGLVLVGRPLYGDTFRRLASEMERRGLAGRFVWLSDVEDEELPAIYHHATAAIAPSLYEGFGLTLLEAMAAGAPVLACANGTYEEVAGEAAVYFDGRSETSIAEQLVRVTGDEPFRKELIRRGDQRVRAFSWQETARRTWQVYERFLWPSEASGASATR